MIHGAFNELWGPHELKSRWLPALQDGLWHHGQAIDSDDVGVCFYGDLFRLDLATLDVDEWKKSRAGAEDTIAAFAGDGGLEALSQAAGAATYERTIDLVTIMSNDATVRAAAQQRLLDQIAPDTRVVVAHSLGTIISYNTLRQHPEVELDTLITLGSPLGSGFFAPAEDGSDPWPGSVKRWVNVTAPTDLIASPSKVGEAYGDRVEEHTCDNGHRGHAPEPYLNSRPTGAAVARALTD
jgi:pimeloyl-ACP methyl ester carboxylesterase